MKANEVFAGNDGAVTRATVIQWLGSNVGFSFVEECLGEAGYRVVPKKDRERP